MDIKISVSPGNMDNLPSEVMVTTKFEKRKAFEECLEVIPDTPHRNSKIEVNKILYSQQSMVKKKSSRGSLNINRDDSIKTKANFSANDITKMLLTMGKLY
jgi:hypothetical protein